MSVFTLDSLDFLPRAAGHVNGIHAVMRSLMTWASVNWNQQSVENDAICNGAAATVNFDRNLAMMWLHMLSILSISQQHKQCTSS